MSYCQSAHCLSQNSVADTLQTHLVSTAEIYYVIVFGYPPDKYSVTAEYFKSIGDTTDPDPNIQITNCFRIGYRDFGEGMRAVKRNGEILGGSYMIGVKWAVGSSSSGFWLPWLTFITSRIKYVQMRSLPKQLAADWCPSCQWKRRRRTLWPSTRVLPLMGTQALHRMEPQSDWHLPLRLFGNQDSLRRKGQ